MIWSTLIIPECRFVHKKKKKGHWNKINQENKSRGAELLFNTKADTRDPVLILNLA